MNHTLEWLLFGMFILLNRMAALVPASLAMPALQFAPRPALSATDMAEMASRRNPRLTLLITEPHAAP
jgi:hypothetical protein